MSKLVIVPVMFDTKPIRQGSCLSLRLGAMPSGAGGEPRPTGAALGSDDADRILVFQARRLALGFAFLQSNRAAVGAQTTLRQARQFLRKVLGDAARLAVCG